MAAQEGVDAVLIAGDLYDHRSPAPEADALVFEALVRLLPDGAGPGGGGHELSMGFEYAVSPSRLPAAASSVALGHVHRPQAVRGAPSPTRYAGSLLQLDFGETEQTKSVTIVEARPNRPAKVREVALSAGRRLLAVEGTLDEVLDKGGSL